MMKRIIRHILLAFSVGIFAGIAGAQTTAFTYQGNLSAGGVPANGNYDFQFLLFSAATGGSPIGLGFGVNNVAVTNGSFSVILNFQNQFPGAERWIEIRVRPAGQGNHTTLTPRQPVLSSPYSINAAQLGGVAANQFVLTADPRLTDARNPLPNSGNYIQNRATTQAASSFNISGNGTVGGFFTAKDNGFFEKALSVGTTLEAGGATTIGSTLKAGGATTLDSTLTVASTASINGTVNTSSHYRINNNQVLTRSRLDLFNTEQIPRGYSLEAINGPNFLVLSNDSAQPILTVAQNGNVGIGVTNPNTATLEIGGTLAVTGLGGTQGDPLCRDGNLIRACSTIPPPGASVPVERLEATVMRLQSEIEKQRQEIEELRQIVCAISATVCKKE